MKRIISLLIIIIFSITISACSDDSKPNALAQVGNEDITEYDIQEYISLVAHSQGTNLEDALDEYNNEYVKNMVLEDMVSTVQKKQYLDDKDITILSIKEEEELQSYLNNVITDEKLNAFVKENNITEKSLINFFMRNYIAEAFQIEMVKEMKTLDADAKTYYEKNKENYESEKVKAFHILTETKEEAEEIISRLDQGETFEALAKEKSTDKNTAINGGDLGTFGRGESFEEFENKVFSMTIGEISEPFESMYGFHIIKLQNKFKEIPIYQEVEAAIKDKLIIDYTNNRIDELNNKYTVVLCQ